MTKQLLPARRFWIAWLCAVVLVPAAAFSGVTTPHLIPMQGTVSDLADTPLFTGDLLVRIVVDVPDELDEEQEELFRRLAELRGEPVADPDQGFFSKIKSAFT